MVKKIKTLKYYEAIGRRKTAIARLRLYIVGSDKSVTIKDPKNEGNLKIKQGEIYFNGKKIESIFSSQADQAKYIFPLKITDNLDRFAVSIFVRGGGRSGQIDAIRHAFARAIEKIDRDQYRPSLKKLGLLTRDSRTRERRKVGTGGKARRAKQSPKR